MTRATLVQRPSSAAVPTLGAEEFRRIAALLYETSGIHLPEGKASLVHSRLTKRLRALGLSSFRDYCTLLHRDDGADERQMMLSALTTNLTKFYREEHHFKDLAAQVQRWMPAVRAGGRLRLWSAACSSGEEAYSMGVTLLSAAPDALDYDVRILATDIDPEMVERGRRGVYSAEAMAPVPTTQRDRFMERQRDGSYAVGEALREVVAFRELNLIGDWPMRGKFQAIFCRNVAIYFDGPTQDRLWGRLAERLLRDGKLYIGHSERAANPRLVSDGLTAYRLAGG